jgi:hypothetical protein
VCATLTPIPAVKDVCMSDWKHTKKSNRDIYQVDINDDVVVLAAIHKAAPNDVGAVKQVASPAVCSGRRIRFQAELSTDVTEGAGLWLTASHKEWHITDGMYDRLIKGSTEWNQVQLVIDVPEDAAYISYGLWMIGNGKCSMRQARFDVVEHSVAVTTKSIWDRVAEQKWIERAV